MNQNLQEKDNLGLGVHIIEISEMEKTLNDTPGFSNKTFSKNEILFCNNFTNLSSVYFSCIYAIKNAVLKALNMQIDDNFNYLDIEVKYNDKNKPYVVFNNDLKIKVDKLKFNDFLVSQSYTKKDAVGMAVILKPGQDTNSLECTLNPNQLLSKKFKEVKKILDTI